MLRYKFVKLRFFSKVFRHRITQNYTEENKLFVIFCHLDSVLFRVLLWPRFCFGCGYAVLCTSA